MTWIMIVIFIIIVSYLVGNGNQQPCQRVIVEKEGSAVIREEAIAIIKSRDTLFLEDGCPKGF